MQFEKRLFSKALPILALCLLLPAFTMTARAEEPAAQKNKNTDGEASPGSQAPMPEVVVTGKRAKEDPFTADRSVTVVSEQELVESSPRTTPEALWNAPGVFVQQTNNGGGSPILRGMIGPQVLLMVDGIRLNNSTYRTGPVQYLNMIDPFSIDRIEVLRGPGSVLYGSDAMGGVIQVFPIAPGDFRTPHAYNASGRLAYRFEAANSGSSLHGHLSTGSGGFSLLAGATYKDIGNLIAGGDIGEQPYSGYENTSAIGGLTYRFSDGFTSGWTAKIGYLFNRIENAGRTDKLWDKHSLQMYDNDDHLVYGKVHMIFRPIHTTADVSLSYQNFFERKDAHTVGDNFRAVLYTTRDDVQADTMGMDLAMQTSLAGNRVQLNYGAMWYRDWASAERRNRPADSIWFPAADNAYPDGSTYDTFGLYIMGQGDPLTLKNHTLRMTAGYRMHGMQGFAPETASLPEVDFGDIGHVFHAGVQYLYARTATVALTFSQGFRAPNLQEAIMLGDTGKYFHIPNDDLGPETNDTLELLGRIRMWRVTATWAGYVSFLHNLIKRVPATYKGQSEIAGKDVYHNVNGNEGLLLGTEATLRVDIGWGLSAFGNITYTWGEESIPDGEDQPLTRIPPLFGTVTLRYDIPTAHPVKGFIEAYVRAAGKQDRLSAEDKADSRIPEGGTPGWWTLNVRIGATLYEHIRLSMAIENMLDEEYKYHASGIYSPGFNAIMTAELMF